MQRVFLAATGKTFSGQRGNHEEENLPLVKLDFFFCPVSEMCLLVLSLIFIFIFTGIM